jgi:NACHT domain
MDGREFEDEVLRIARAMWPSAEGDGAIIVLQRERDGVFVTADQVHLIEATMLRTKDKAQKDGAKLDQLVRKYASSYPFHSIKGWFITNDEPTAEQRGAIRAFKNEALVAASFAQFRSRLIDAPSYLEARRDHRFGSARTLDEKESWRDLGDYVRMDILEKGTTQRLWDVEHIADGVLSGNRFVLLGDYGAGKSMTAREIYLELRKRYVRKDTHQFPIHLNLREHLGQEDPGEAFSRHALKIGFASPPQLVRAWKSGYAVLILDGFDEMATINWSGELGRVRDARRKAVRLIRTFLQDSPADAGLVVAGREHYFDSPEERREALGYAATARELSLNDFSDEQIELFLGHGKVPSWLPRRPLLLGYLASRGLLPPNAEAVTPAAGWNALLDGVSDRESQIEAGIDGPTVRRLLERVGSLARRTSEGLGPVTFDEITDAFHQVVGARPDETALTLLQRLPGLGVADAQTGTRHFIDTAFADAAQAGDPVTFAQDPFTTELSLDAKLWTRALGDLGIEVLALRADEAGLLGGPIGVATSRALEHEWPILASDFARTVSATGGTVGDATVLREVLIEDLGLGYTDADLSRVMFEDSVVQRLDLNMPITVATLPVFAGCYFGEVMGATSQRDLPAENFQACEFGGFSEQTSTTQGILALNLALPARVALTILKKLYLQSGMGRRDGALRRGLNEQARRCVDPVLDLLVTEGLIVPSKQGRQVVWQPVRSATTRVRSLLESPLSAEDDLLPRIAKAVS